jgi:signal transduction histidine kinase
MTVNSSATGREIVAAYRAHDRTVRARYSLIGHALIVVLMPLGAALDWYVYPDVLNEFLTVRLAVAAVAGIACGLHYLQLVQRHIHWFSMVVPLLVNAVMSWMILRTEGVLSPYYAGLNLLITAMGVLVPWSFVETTVACIVTMGFYVAACVLHGGVFDQVSVLFNNLYFLVLTSVICATSAHFKARGRFEEFRLRSELAQSYQQVSALERAKTEFFANVSHELRTPLTLILAPLGDLLRRPALPEDIRELLALAHGNSLRLLKLINDLLELIRVESQEVALVAEPVELGQFVKAQSESVRQLVRLKGLDLVVDVPDTPMWTMVDPVHLEKILVNLLTNAVKFTPAKGRICVSTRQQGAMAVVEVADTGIGISEAELPYIFDRFRQADGSATRRFSGLGIGLALARQLAQKHGAEISVESRLGQGSTFRLHVPSRQLAGDFALPAPDAADDPVVRLFRDADRFIPVDDQGTHAPTQAAGGSIRATVLVIDDEPDMRRYLGSILADRYAVHSASDGVAGLALAREARPELVLVDLMMPGMDGWQVCTTLKQELGEKAPKIVVVTARTDETAKIRALEQGADDFLTKPFSTLEVRTRLANLLRAQTLERSLRAQNVELAQAMKKLETAEAQLVRREKMVAVSRMAGGILHEINNPLNFTLTAIGIALARAPATDAGLRDILRDVEAGMQRIRDIVADLRDFAMPGRSASHVSFDLGRTVERALQLTSTQLGGVRVERELSPACPAYGSESQVLQVLVNLLLNAEAALRASHADRSPTIRIGATTTDRRRLRVFVWDNGIGMPASLLDKVFDPFVTTKDVGQGMGLGLSICNTLVEAHGGSMSVRSEEGEWTEVSFELPLQPQEGVA